MGITCEVSVVVKRNKLLILRPDRFPKPVRSRWLKVESKKVGCYMLSKLKISFLLIMFILISMQSILYSQNFQNINSKQGISQNSGNAITQDKNGFIWVGTQDGLNKYDGYKFTVYKNKLADSTSLIDNFILSLLVDKNGDLWVGTTFGLDRLKSGSDNFEHISLQPAARKEKINEGINSLIQDHLGNIWIGTYDGIYIYKPETKSLQSFQILLTKPDTLPSKFIYKLFSDSKNNIWIGSSKGLSSFNIDKKTIVNYYSAPNNKNTLSSNVITDIKEDKMKVLWIGTANGLNSYDPSTQLFSRYLNEFNNNLSISNNNISSLFVDKYNDVWVGTMAGGLNKFHRPTGTFFHFVNSIDNLNSIAHNDILSIMEDRTQVLWVGSDGGGLSLYDGKPIKFQHILGQTKTDNSINSNDIWALFYEEDESKTYVGTNDGGLNIISDNGEVISLSNNPANNNSISSNKVYSILKTKSGDFWIGTDADLDKLDIKTNKFIHYFSAKLGKRVSIRFLTEDSEGIIWCGNSNSLISFNPETSEYIEYKNDINDQTTITPGQPSVFFEDSKNRVWIGTTFGLNLFNRKNKKFEQFTNDPQNSNSISYPSISSIIEDKRGNIWLGTGLGLCVYNPELKKFKSFYESDGLPNVCIYNILNDGKGNFWASTNNGLTKFDPLKIISAEKEKLPSLFRNFTQQDGLQSNEFNGGAAFRAKSGELFFGGINGFNRFYPEKVIDNPYIPQVEITDFKILDVAVNLGKWGDQIVLNSTQNVFSYEFAALDFTKPEKNQYAYRLEGFDKEWIYSGTRRFVSYTNLDPGHYTFHVKGSNNDGIWNESGISLPIEILPPWYKTNIAYIIYFFSSLGFMYGFVRLQISRTKIKERQKAEHKETRRQSEELEKARKMQLSMLPQNNIDNSEISVYGKMRTASEVGGDYYDFIRIDDNRYCIAAGDATGHGNAAGLIVGMVKIALISSVGKQHQGFSLSELMQTINLSLKQSMNYRGMGMCLTVLIIDLKSGEFEISSSGFPYPYFFSKQNNQLTPLVFQGPPLGFMENVKFPTQHFTMQPGDLLYLMSDGFAERMDASDKMYGYEKIEDDIKSIISDGVEYGVDRLFALNDEFANGRLNDDDMTVVVVRKK